MAGKQDRAEMFFHAEMPGQSFRTLAPEGIKIRRISTSELKISVGVDEKYLELAVRALHNAFKLDQAAQR